MQAEKALLQSTRVLHRPSHEHLLQLDIWRCKDSLHQLLLSDPGAANRFARLLALRWPGCLLSPKDPFWQPQSDMMGLRDVNL